jgi:hypothetical protein
MRIEYGRSIEVLAEPDVLVAGAGCAGMAAAISSARMGAKTMVVEQWGFAGGNITAALVTGCCGLCDQGTGEVVVGGIVLEILERTGMLKLPLASKKLFHPVLTQEGIEQDPGKLPVRFDPEKTKIIADNMFAEAGVESLYHTKVADVRCTDSRIEYVIIANKGGISAIRPKVVIDCTGDADLAAWAGVPCEVDPRPETMTLVFVITDVEMTKDLYTLQKKCAAVLQEAHRRGAMGLYGGPWIGSPRPGVIKVNATRLPFNSADPAELNLAEKQGRKDAWTMFELWKEHIPEFRNAYFQVSGPVAGPRESRRIVGEYTLTLDDVLSTRSFPDAIVKGAWYVDRHPHVAGYHHHTLVKPYDIPFRTLVPKGVDELLVAGRCHSATSDALASSRTAVTAMGMGQAAGIAAAMAVADKKTPREVDIARLQDALLQQGAILEIRQTSAA